MRIYLDQVPRLIGNILPTITISGPYTTSSHTPPTMQKLRKISFTWDKGDGRVEDMKFVSWNIDSLNAALLGKSDRSVQSRQVLASIRGENPEVIAIQETKLPATGPSKKHLTALSQFFDDYDVHWRSSVEPARKGYAGTMCLSKKGLPLVTVTEPWIHSPEPMDCEGRLQTLEFPDFYLVNVYTPNSGDGLHRLSDRQLWDDAYRAYLTELDEAKPILACGDFNVAHQEIDLAHPASNHHSAGFTDEERQKFTALLGAGFTDTYRYLHPNQAGAYTWWAQRAVTSKANNSGWRIDYWLVSNRLNSRVKQSTMIDTGDRRDHAPILLDITC